MRAVTEPAAWLAGVLVGDGWVTDRTLGLRSADYEFAVAFAGAVSVVTGRHREPRKDERGYWLYRTSNKTGQFNALRDAVVTTPDQVAAWVRGLFDSEGNAGLRQHPNWKNCKIRRVAIFSTNTATLTTAIVRLGQIGIGVLLRRAHSGSGHKGTKPVYQVILRGDRENYQRFADLVGSSIPRKARILDAIPLSYCPDYRAAMQAAQAKGVKSRRRNRELRCAQ